jgi:hypothetical protein
MPLLFDTRAAAAATSIPSGTNCFYTAGYSTVGDGGDALYVKISAPGTPQPWQFQSADGAWWQLTNDLVRPEHFGARANNSDDDTTPVKNWFSYALAGMPGKIMLSGKTYKCGSTITLDGQGQSLLPNHDNITVYGVGPMSALNLQGSPGILIDSASGIGYLKFVDMLLYSGLNTNTLVHTKAVFGLLTLDSVYFNGGDTGLYLDSQVQSGSGINGTLSLHARSCLFINQASFGIYGVPQSTNLVENIHIDSCEFQSQGGTGLRLSGADAIFVRGCRWERVEISSSSAHIHIDTTFAVHINDCYLEEGGPSSNPNPVPLIQLGSGVKEIWVDHNYFSVLVNGGSSASAVTLNTGAPVNQLSFCDNHIVVNGNIPAPGAVFSATVTNLHRHGNTIQVNGGNTVNSGWQDGGSAANMASYGNNFNAGGGMLTHPTTYSEPVFYGFTFPLTVNTI